MPNNTFSRRGCKALHDMQRFAVFTAAMQPGASKLSAKRVYVRGVLLLVAIVILLAWQTRGPTDPVYDGKPLSHWLKGHTASSSASPPYGSPGWKKADEIL